MRIGQGAADINSARQAEPYRNREPGPGKEVSSRENNAAGSVGRPDHWGARAVRVDEDIEVNLEALCDANHLTERVLQRLKDNYYDTPEAARELARELLQAL